MLRFGLRLGLEHGIETPDRRAFFVEAPRYTLWSSKDKVLCKTYKVVVVVDVPSVTFVDNFCLQEYPTSPIYDIIWP